MRARDSQVRQLRLVIPAFAGGGRMISFELEISRTT